MKHSDKQPTSHLDNTDRETQRRAILLSVYAFTGGNPSRMVLIKEELQPEIKVPGEVIWDLAAPIIHDEGWMLWGAGGRLSITFTGVPIVEEMIRAWVISRMPRTSLAEVLDRAYRVLQELEWQRYCLMRTIRTVSRGELGGWADYDRVVEETGLEENAIRLAGTVLKAMDYIKEPEIDSIDLTINGDREFERIQNLLAASNKSRDIGPREFAATLPKIWSPSAERPKEAQQFPTPAGVTWSDIEIRFMDNTTVRVTANGMTRVFNFAQMGMVDRRRGLPDRQWELLLTLAESHGVLSWHSRGASPRRQKIKERLSESLRSFFGIDEEPIPWDEGAWKAKLRIRQHE